MVEHSSKILANKKKATATSLFDPQLTERVNINTNKAHARGKGTGRTENVNINTHRSHRRVRKHS